MVAGKYRQKLLNHANQSAKDAFKTISKSNLKSSGINW